MTIGTSFLGDNPQAAFMSAIPRMFGQGQRRFLSDRYSDIYGDFQGALGEQARGGGLPTLNFTDYLRSMPWLNYYYGFSPQQRGEGQSRFAPQLRYYL